MATAGTYKELTAGYEKVKSVSGITAVRQFIDSYPGATDSLPEVGDPLDETDSTLIGVVVKSVRETYYGNDATQKLYVVSYDNQPGNEDDSDENPTDPDLLPVSGGLSGEAINIDGTLNGSLFVWKDARTTKCDQQLFKKILSGSFKVTKRVTLLELGKWAEYSGKINNANFHVAGNTFGTGLVLFNGVEYEEYRNSKGERRWRVSFSFSVKAQPKPTGETGYYGWNYFYDQKTGKFREVVAKASADSTDESTDQPLYVSANLGLLLSGVDEE